MDKIGIVEVRRQEGLPTPKRPADGTPVWMAIDISRSKAVYCLRWEGIEHVRALLEHYRGCQVQVARPSTARCRLPSTPACRPPEVSVSAIPLAV